jgi:hypothetical protein
MIYHTFYCPRHFRHPQQPPTIIKIKVKKKEWKDGIMGPSCLGMESYIAETFNFA